ncbi:MAG: PaaI family thioesterase [Cyclobacteriaceae bacterium]|nr:PaaI family thioesterase [Cyclobacteriaceae bacterium]
MEKKNDFFQAHMPENVCYGCGQLNEEGLQIESFWDGSLSVCEWLPEEKYHGWANLLNGGVMATLIDCHCMGTAMADAYRRENRSLDSEPVYRYATGTLSVRYLKPTPIHQQVVLKARVIEAKGRKTTLSCQVYSGEVLTAEADVVAIRVYDSQTAHENNPFK